MESIMPYAGMLHKQGEAIRYGNGTKQAQETSRDKAWRDALKENPSEGVPWFKKCLGIIASDKYSTYNIKYSSLIGWKDSSETLHNLNK